MFTGIDIGLKNALPYTGGNLMKGNAGNLQRGESRLIEIHKEDSILRTFILFVQTADAVLKYADAYFYRKARLSIIKFVALQGLSASGGTMTATEIARWTLREPHNITTLVNRLKQDGLVKTEHNKADKRFVNVTLTDKGWEVLSQAKPAAREIVNQVMSSISQDDAGLLEKQLGVMRQNAHQGLERVAQSS